MTLAEDLLAQARMLARREPRRPKQASLRRSISSSYYAVFHQLAAAVAERLMPKSREVHRAYLHRALDHARIREVAGAFARGKGQPEWVLAGGPVPAALATIAKHCVALQELRHAADYDIARRFTRPDALEAHATASEAMALWRQVRGTPAADLFLVALLVKSRA